MTLKELKKEMIAEWIDFHDNMLSAKNKSAQRRARVASLELTKLMKEFRKMSLAEDKK